MARPRSGNSSGNSDRITGKIARLQTSKGFGFIKGAQGDYFFHMTAFQGEFSSLREGDEVSFLPSDGAKGLRAESVELER